ncbi:MAG: hypothetical protein V3W19_09550, partial [Desulfatiglandales bacterium]
MESSKMASIKENKPKVKSSEWSTRAPFIFPISSQNLALMMDVRINSSGLSEANFAIETRETKRLMP